MKHLNIKRSWLLVSIFLLTIFNLFIFGNIAHAEAANLQYSYSVEIDDAKNTSAIQQNVKSGQTLNVKLVFSNNSNQSQNLRVNFNTAVTGDNGVIQYNFNDLKGRYLGDVNFNKLIRGPKTIQLAAKAKVIKEYIVRVPDKRFSGVIAGGFYISQNNAQSSKAEKDSVNFKNTISYALPIVLKESNQQVNTKLKLNSVSAKMHYDYPTVIAKIDNITPTLFGEMNITSKIVDKDTDQVVFKQKQTSMNMAPLTRLSYPITLNKKLDAGEYKLKVAVSSGKAHWNFSHDFSINAKVAAATKKQSHSKQGVPVWIYITIGALVIVALMVGVYYLGKSKSKQVNK